MAAKHNLKGRSKSQGDHGTYIRRPFMERAAWRALSPKAQILYIWLKLEWKGEKYNNNGHIQLSCRQAARLIGVTINTANHAFHELQAKGFIVVTELGALGLEGEARGPSYELTELKLPRSNRPSGRKLYRDWLPNKDFQIVRHQANNPNGMNGKSRTPSSKQGRSHHAISDVCLNPVIDIETPHHQNSDVSATSSTSTIIEMRTSLVATQNSDATAQCDRSY